MKKVIEIFSAGCPICDEQIAIIKREAGDDWEIVVSNISADKEAYKRSKAYMIKSVPAVVVDGVLAACCWKSGIDMKVLRSMGLGKKK